jgi:hypothetical protein
MPKMFFVKNLAGLADLKKEGHKLPQLALVLCLQMLQKLFGWRLAVFFNRTDHRKTRPAVDDVSAILIYIIVLRRHVVNLYINYSIPTRDLFKKSFGKDSTQINPVFG